MIDKVENTGIKVERDIAEASIESVFAGIMDIVNSGASDLVIVRALEVVSDAFAKGPLTNITISGCQISMDRGDEEQ